jgi:hypothetical protein
MESQSDQKSHMDLVSPFSDFLFVKTNFKEVNLFFFMPDWLTLFSFFRRRARKFNIRLDHVSLLLQIISTIPPLSYILYDVRALLSASSFR